MWLVLAEDTDPSAGWAYEGLADRDLKPIELITSDMIGPALRWRHCVGVDCASVEICFDNGRVINSQDIHGVLNRFRGVPNWLLPQKVAEEDKEYARQELTAFFLSWLFSFAGKIFNPPSPQGLAGRELLPAEWLFMAKAAGLETPSLRELEGRGAATPTVEYSSPSVPGMTVVHVIGGAAVGEAAPPVLRLCKRLAVLVGTSILSVRLIAGRRDGWIFGGATSFPDLRSGGEPVLDALAELLRTGSAVA